MKQLVSKRSKGQGEEADEELDRIMAASKEKGSFVDDPDQQEKEKIVVEMLCADSETAPDQIEAVNFSVLMSPLQLRDVLESRNALILSLAKKDQDAAQKLTEIADLKSTLEHELSKAQPNIKEIVDKQVSQAVETERREFDKERQMLHSDLQNRVDKVLKLEMQLDEMRDGYKQLESTISKDDLKYMRKALNLEKNLESIN